MTLRSARPCSLLAWWSSAQPLQRLLHQALFQKPFLMRSRSSGGIGVARILLHPGEHVEVVAHGEAGPEDPPQHEGLQGIDKVRKSRLVVDAEAAGLEVIGLRSEPHGHLGDYAEVRLGEEAVEVGTYAPTVEFRGLRVPEAVRELLHRVLVAHPPHLLPVSW